MKRFLSLFLSALVTLQIANVCCDAATHYRNTTPNYNSAGGAYQGQPAMFIQPSQYMPQKEPVINIALPEQSAPVVNVNPTPQSIAVQAPAVNIEKVDATSWGDKFTGWLRFVFYGLLTGVVVYVGMSMYTLWGNLIETFKMVEPPSNTFKHWQDYFKPSKWKEHSNKQLERLYKVEPGTFSARYPK